MDWSDDLRIETPEQIEVELELAGLGSRFFAQFIDWAIKLLVFAVLGLLTGLAVGFSNLGGATQEPTPLVLAVVIGAVYVMFLGYGVLFEARWNGQTPGKRWSGIRVVRANGAPIDFTAAATRNFLALADFMPMFMALGAVLVLVSKRRQRLGDMAAGTVVVRERVESLGADPPEEVAAHAAGDYLFTATHLAGLEAKDRAVLRSFLRRFDSMESTSRARLAASLAATYAKRTGYELPATFASGDARPFLASLLRDLEERARRG